jgi:hypothetical protein
MFDEFDFLLFMLTTRVSTAVPSAAVCVENRSSITVLPRYEKGKHIVF